MGKNKRNSIVFFPTFNKSSNSLNRYSEKKKIKVIIVYMLFMKNIMLNMKIIQVKKIVIIDCNFNWRWWNN